MWFQYLITVLVMVAGTCMDIRRKRIRRWLPVIYFQAVLAGRTAELFLNGFWKEAAGRTDLLSGMALEIGAGMIPGIFCMLLSFLTGQAVGYGDSLLILICGMGIGAADCMQMLMTALAGAGLWGLLLILLRRADKKCEIPFVPFLLLGVLFTLRSQL